MTRAESCTLTGWRHDPSRFGSFSRRLKALIYRSDAGLAGCLLGLIGCAAFAVPAAAAPSGMLAGVFVMDLARDAARSVWAGTEDGGVLRGDPDAGTWEVFKVQGVDGENHA